MLKITSQEKRELKAEAHSLKPVVIVGSNGLTPAVLQEINNALDVHELIKIRIGEEDRLVRAEVATKICKDTHSALIQTIGSIAIIYRKNKKLES
ncbi:MAG: ribosome assembly RNA-binding protein YhbY [Gammaproteobacteria bacterium]